MNEEIYTVDYSDFANKYIPHFIRIKDFDIKEGDFKLGNTNEQESYFILESSKGNYYNSLKLGFSIRKYLAADIDKNEFKKKIRENLERDSFKVREVYVVTKGDLNLLNINDPELINIINQNGFIVSPDISR